MCPPSAVRRPPSGPVAAGPRSSTRTGCYPALPALSIVPRTARPAAGLFRVCLVFLRDVSGMAHHTILDHTTPHNQSSWTSCVDLGRPTWHDRLSTTDLARPTRSCPAAAAAASLALVQARAVCAGLASADGARAVERIEHRAGSFARLSRSSPLAPVDCCRWQAKGERACELARGRGKPSSAVRTSRLGPAATDALLSARARALAAGTTRRGDTSSGGSRRTRSETTHRTYDHGDCVPRAASWVPRTPVGLVIGPSPDPDPDPDTDINIDIDIDIGPDDPGWACSGPDAGDARDSQQIRRGGVGADEMGRVDAKGSLRPDDVQHMSPSRKAPPPTPSAPVVDTGDILGPDRPGLGPGSRCVTAFGSGNSDPFCRDAVSRGDRTGPHRTPPSGPGPEKPPLAHRPRRPRPSSSARQTR
ncbi:unnamed protein product [Diplocarpon coronariae]